MAKVVATAEQAGLMRTSRRWAEVLRSRDLEKILSFWADDAIVMPPDQPALLGKAAIRQYVVECLAIPGFSITWEPEFARVGGRGDIGYLVERSRFTLPDVTGALVTRYAKTVTVWRKNPAGEWRCVIDIWNGNPSETALTHG
jgi:ketosteroid isomerase-like protein